MLHWTNGVTILISIHLVEIGHFIYLKTSKHYSGKRSYEIIDGQQAAYLENILLVA